MREVSTIGLDLAKNVFQAHGADASGAVAFRKQMRRGQVLEFFGRQARCLVAMEACSGAHFWAREIGRLGHEVRLIPPIYVKPFVKLCAAEHNFTYHQEDILRRKVSRTPVFRSFQRNFLRIISGALRLS
jgi:transposase